VIKASLNAGGSLLAALFFREAMLTGGFLVVASIAVFALIAVLAFLFTRLNPGFFILSTAVWLFALILLS
jgi:hypothetical protein